MPSCLASHLICKLYQAIIFYYMLNLLTILVHSITLPVHQPFGMVMEKSGVETRSSEQTMLSDEAHVLLVTDSSSEEDSETDDQSYPPPSRGAWSNLAGLYCSYHAHGVLHCHAIFFFITYSICRQSVYIEILFMCISHLSRLWKNLEWNKVFRADNGTCWSIYLDGYRELLRGGFRDRWPVIFPPWGACPNLAGLCYSYRAYGILHCYAICLVWTCFVWMPPV